MKKLLLLLPFLLLIGCEEKELTFEEKRIKAEESARKYVDTYAKDYYEKHTYHADYFRREDKIINYFKNGIIPPRISFEEGYIERTYTETNYSIVLVADEDNTFSFLVYLNKDFVVITGRWLTDITGHVGL